MERNVMKEVEPLESDKGFHLLALGTATGTTGSLAPR